MDDNNLKSLLEIRPTKLLSMFFFGSCISLIIIIFLIYYGMTNLFQNYFLQEAQSDSITIASTLLTLEKSVFQNFSVLTKKGKHNTKLKEQFDKRMREHLKKFNVIKIKIFNKDYKIIYSTDKKIIGARDPNNQRLLAALLGKVVTAFKQKSQLTDLQNKTKFNTDVVETYLPILTKDKKILGASEIYLDITKYRNTAVRMAYLSSGVIGLLLLVTFFFLYLLMRRGTKQINRYENLLSEMAIRDPLTNLFNRRELMARAEEEFIRARRSAARNHQAVKLAFIMIDIDHFKLINDEQGHLAGDYILKELSVRIKTALRQYDIFGRYGGEEFLILLVDATPETIREVAKRIWDIVRNTPFKFDDKKIHVTISLGLATVSKEAASVKDIIEKADKALYKAKESGRDQIQEDEGCCAD